MEEVWKDVYRYEGYYQISNFGNVKSIERTIVRKDGVKTKLKEKILKPGLISVGYRTVSLYKNGIHKTHCIHTLIMNPPVGFMVDHIDRNKENNIESNLRYCTRVQNYANAIKMNNCSSIYKGVTWDKQSKKWKANIMVNYKNHNLGLFEKEVNAAKVRDKRAKQLYGEFANLNFK